MATYSSDDLCLRLAAPDGYTTVDAVSAHDPVNGGIAVFTARSSYACAVLGIVILSVFASVTSVRLFVTRLLCDETKEHRPTAYILILHEK